MWNLKQFFGSFQCCFVSDGDKMGSHLSKLSPFHTSYTSTPKRTGFTVLVKQDGIFLGKGRVDILTDDLVLQMLEGSSERFSWPIRSIRRYGCVKKVFTFESGRRCNSGPGVYNMKTKHAKEMLERLQYCVNNIQEADKAARTAAISSCRAVAAADGELRYTEHGKTSPSNNSSRGDPPHYVNCDSSGRYKGDVVDQGVDRAYAQLDLDQLNAHNSNIDALPGSNGDDSGSQDGPPRQRLSGIPAEGGDGWRGASSVSYVKIDPLKTRAAAALTRPDA